MRSPATTVCPTGSRRCSTKPRVLVSLNRPSSSSAEHIAFFNSLGLPVAQDDGASDDFEAVLGEVITWYLQPERAASARVVAATSEDLTRVLRAWLGRELPALNGDALIAYVADSLLIDAGHGNSHSQTPRLLALASEAGTLYMLRPDPGTSDGVFVTTLHSPDTEAALSGVFRIDGCSPAFEDHASSCTHCLAALEKTDQKYGLPDGFERFRRHPVRVPPPPPTPLPPVSGVAIIIRRRPWWAFWRR